MSVRQAVLVLHEKPEAFEEVLTFGFHFFCVANVSVVFEDSLRVQVM